MSWLALYHSMRYDVNMTKKKTSIRYSDEAKILLEKLSKHLGISQSAVLELAIRTLAKQEGISQQA
jgi:predicted DNA-binding protein